VLFVVVIIQWVKLLFLFVEFVQQQPIEQFIFAVAFVEFVLLVKPVKLLK
jgi:hypothetical protein